MNKIKLKIILAMFGAVGIFYANPAFAQSPEASDAINCFYGGSDCGELAGNLKDKSLQAIKTTDFKVFYGRWQDVKNVSKLSTTCRKITKENLLRLLKREKFTSLGGDISELGLEARTDRRIYSFYNNPRKCVRDIRMIRMGQK